MMFNLQTAENYPNIFTIVIFFKQNIVIVIVPLSPRPNMYRMKLLNKGHLEIGNSTLKRQGYTASLITNQMSSTSFLECPYLIYLFKSTAQKNLVFSCR